MGAEVALIAAVLKHTRQLIHREGWQAANWEGVAERPQRGPWSLFDAIRNHGCSSCPAANWAQMAAVRDFLERFTECRLPYWDAKPFRSKADALRVLDLALLTLGVTAPRIHRGGWHVSPYPPPSAVPPSHRGAA